MRVNLGKLLLESRLTRSELSNSIDKPLAIYGVAQSRTRLKRISSSSSSREPSSVSVLSSNEVVPAEAKAVLAWNTKGTCLD